MDENASPEICSRPNDKQVDRSTAFALGFPEIRRKTRRCRKNAYDGLENAYLIVFILVNRNVTEMSVNCGSRNARCSVYKVEIISLAFKWLLSYFGRFKNALKMRLPRPKTRTKRTFTRLARRLEAMKVVWSATAN